MQNKQVTVTENNAANVSFSPLALGNVKAQSWLKNQLRLLADNLTGNFEQISPDCAVEGGNRSGWLGGSGEAWERGTYYVRGLVSLAYVLEDESLIRKAQKWIDWTLQSQTESGAFGPYADDPKNFDWWPLMPMLMALEEYCDATGGWRAWFLFWRSILTIRKRLCNPNLCRIGERRAEEIISLRCGGCMKKTVINLCLIFVG